MAGSPFKLAVCCQFAANSMDSMDTMDTMDKTMPCLVHSIDRMDTMETMDNFRSSHTQKRSQVRVLFRPLERPPYMGVFS